jgi:curved DNA-binding protein CbpA
MKTKQALAILNLKPDSCLEDAKDSYRNLAKLYHPDKLNIDNHPPANGDRMKDINAAFSFLKKNLPHQKIIKEKISPSETKRKKDFSSPVDFKAFFRKMHQTFFNPSSKTPKKTAPSTKARPVPKPSKASNKFKRGLFDSILNTKINKSHNSDFKKPDKIKARQPSKTKNTYTEYMDLKQKMSSKRKHSKIDGFAPIKKVSPISPIKKI